jgi:hypothetical protein
VLCLPDLKICHTDCFRSHDYNDTFSVLVGAEEQCFTVHKGVLCSKSKFFRAACGERWKSGQEKIVRLPEVEAMVFQRYVDWAYGDILVSEKDSKADMVMLVHLYLLGDKLDDVKLRNKAIKAMTSCSYVNRLAPHASTITLIWSNTTPSSPLRKWIIDHKMLRYSRPEFAKEITEYPAELVQQIALKFIGQTPSQSADVFQAKLPEYLETEAEDNE